MGEMLQRGRCRRAWRAYHDDAVNHQVMQAPVEGQAALRAMFRADFAPEAARSGDHMTSQALRTSVSV